MANVLNFSTNNLITGANFIEGNLYWTDDRNEPKKIEIERWKADDIGINSGVTTVDGLLMDHTDITVIRPHPSVPIELELLSYDDASFDQIRTTQPEPPFEQIFPRFSYRWRYEDGQYSPFAPFTQAAFIPAPRRLTSTGTRGEPDFVPDTEEANYIEGFNTTMFNNVGRIFLRNIPRGTPDVVEIDLLYTESISSTIYVLETLAIPPAQRGIDFTLTSAYVTRVQGDGFGAVQDTDYEFAPLRYEVSTRKIYSALPANQLTRPYDYVPRLAKAQESTANRLIYGNFLEGYNQPDGVSLDVRTLPAESFPQFEDTTNPDYDAAIQAHLLAQSRMDGQHVKGGRTYEIGVVYIDAFGRQGGMLQNVSQFNEDGTLIEANAFRTDFHQNSREALQVTINSEPPEWADSYRYYIKDVSMDYHNLISYNVYNDGNAEDVNSEFIWIEFQSTDRNKVIEQSQAADGATGTVLVLRRNNDEVLTQKQRFLVQDIQNEAPDDVRRQVNMTVTNTRARQVGTMRFNAYDTRRNAPASVPDVGDVHWFIGSPDSGLRIFDTFLGTINRFVGQNQPEDTSMHQPTNLSTQHESGPLGNDANLIVDLLELNAPLYMRLRDRNNNRYFGGEERYVRITEVRTYDNGGANNTDSARLTLGEQVSIDPDTMEVTILDTTGWPGMDLANTDPNVDFVTTATSDEAIERLGGRFWVRTARNGLATQQSQFSFEGELTELNQLWFETEPAVSASNLDLFWETSDTFCVCTDHGWPNKLNWFNSVAEVNDRGIYLEATRINDRFNTVQLVRGVRVNVPTERFTEERRPFSLTWSGIFNSNTGINRLNEFHRADGNLKNIEPNYGSIQKLYTRDTNLITFAEDKVFRILADKDQLFNADGGGNVSASNAVLGQTTPFSAEYGISTHPESFAYYGHNLYFADANRGAIIQLTPGNGQMFEINNRGLSNTFRDRLFSTANVFGCFDEYSDKYVPSLRGYNPSDMAIEPDTLFPNEVDAMGMPLSAGEGLQTFGYEVETESWTSRVSFIHEGGATLNNKFFTWNSGRLWMHNSNTAPWNNFYGTQFNSEVEIIFNDTPSQVTNFLTLNYEGSSGWTIVSLETDQQSAVLLGSFVEREGKFYQALLANVPNFVYDSTQTNNVRQQGTRVRQGAKGFWCRVRVRNTSTSMAELYAISTEVIPSS